LNANKYRPFAGLSITARTALALVRVQGSDIETNGDFPAYKISEDNLLRHLL